MSLITDTDLIFFFRSFEMKVIGNSDQKEEKEEEEQTQHGVCAVKSV